MSAMILATREERRRDAVTKDKQEVVQKRQEYHGFIDWTDRGIVHDLAQLHNICNPALSLLLPIAINMSDRIGVPLGRQEKRRKDLLVGWMNKNYDQIRTYIPRLVFRDQMGAMKGAYLHEWSTFQERNPQANLINLLN